MHTIDLTEHMNITMTIFTQEAFKEHNINFNIDRHELAELIESNADLIADYARDIILGMILDPENTLDKLAD